MAVSTRARIAGILAICLLMLGAPAAMAGSALQVDALIRTGSGIYFGNNWVSHDGTNQSVTKSGVVGQKLTFYIKIQNEGSFSDFYKVKRSGFFNDGYRVRYYDQDNNDVTGKVNAGTFATPVLQPGVGEYVMRATVKIRSLATACSFTRRLITVSSNDNPNIKDAVRFTAGLAPGCVHLTIGPAFNDPAGSDSYTLGIADAEGLLTFKVTNDGTGASGVLGFNAIVPGPIALGNDSCTGSVLPAGGMCSFQLHPNGGTCISGEPLGVQQVTGGLPPTVVYLTLNVWCFVG